MHILCLAILLIPTVIFAQNYGDSYTIRTLIGSGSRGDAGQATAALLDGPYGLAQDAAGNVYISESNAGAIRRVRPDGVIERYAGSGVIADGVEGQPALQTDLISPTDLIMASDGLIFADPGACRIRKILTDGSIRNLVGTGRCSGSSGRGFPGRGGGGASAGDHPPLETDIGEVGGMVIDASGRLVFSDASGNIVRRVDSDGVVRTIVGTGTGGFGGDAYDATIANLSSPRGLIYDSAGNLYIADSANCRIRSVNTDGVINTVAGTGTCAAASTTWTRTTLGRMNGLAYDGSTNSILISGAAQGRVIRLNLTASPMTMTTYVGSGARGAVDFAAPLQYPIDQPGGILILGSSVLIADTTAFRVLQVQGNTVSAFAGSWPQPSTYTSASSAALLRPAGSCFRPDGSLLVIDAGAERILSFTDPNQLAAFAGARYPTGYSGGDGGPAVLAQLSQPRRLACASNGNVYVSQGRNIRVINPQGTIQTLLSAVRLGDSAVSLNDPTGLAIDSGGGLLFSEASLHQVLRYDFNTKATTLVAGTGTAGFSGDGGAATSAQLTSPGDLAFDSKGNLLIADRGNGRIRRVSPGNIIQTIAGSYAGFSYTDISGNPATSIGLGSIAGLGVDATDNIYISEVSRFSVVRPDGAIYIVGGFLGENDAGAKSYVHGPMNGCDGLATDPKGRLYVSVSGAGQVMLVLPPGDPGDPGPRPSIAPGGVVSASGFGPFPSIAPGSWVEISGANLASTTRQWASSDFNGNQAPTVLDGTKVTIAGQAGFVSYISPTQVNIQVPSTVSAGDQQLILSTAAGASDPYTVKVNSVLPGLLAPSVFLIDGKQYIGALFPDGSTYVLPSSAISGITSRPARAGETITLYGVGFGPVSPPVDAGSVVQQPNTLALTIQIFLDKVPAAVSYAGLVLGAIGLYQMNVVVPSGLQGGATAVTFTLGGTSSSQVLYTAVAN